MGIVRQPESSEVQPTGNGTIANIQDIGDSPFPVTQWTLVYLAANHTEVGTVDRAMELGPATLPRPASGPMDHDGHILKVRRLHLSCPCGLLAALPQSADACQSPVMQALA